MVYEIEKKARVSSKKEFDKYKKLLEGKGEFLEERRMRTFFFIEPGYLRIRYCDGKIIVTHKTGKLGDVARREVNLELNPEQLSGFLALLEVLGFKECACFETLRYCYRFRNVVVELNEIKGLGFYIEAEALTEDKEEIDILSKKISDVLKSLDLKETFPEEYGRLMRDYFLKNAKPVSEQNFK
ncbi:MAG TPA: class IV adenylate cyclase [Candidatus Nanoarchaeia archaeon]|nr:class IV adenylate cyclase [Candidatus Nanoarchaeia archaeon]